MSQREDAATLDPNKIEPTVARTPTILVLDTSWSMTKTGGQSKSRIDLLNEALEFFKDEVESENTAKDRVDVAVVTFGGEVSIESDFTPIDDWKPPTLEASGNTPMGTAIETAFDLDEDRKAEYREHGLGYNRPLIWLLTDGEPTDMEEGDQQWNRIQDFLEEGTKDNHLLFFAMGVGEEANMDVLDELVSVTDQKEGAIPVEEGMFQEVFRVVSNSLQKQSQPGDEVDEEEDIQGQIDAGSDDN